MDSDLLVEWAEKYEEEHLKFDRIPEADRRHTRPDLCGMLLLAELTSAKGDIVTGGEHDEIWFAWSPYKDEVTEEQFVYLARCGIGLDLEHEAFHSFV